MNLENFSSSRSETRDEKRLYILILKAVLIALGILAVAAFTLFGVYRGITNEPFGQSITSTTAPISASNVPLPVESLFPSDSKLMFFNHGQKIFFLRLISILSKKMN